MLAGARPRPTLLHGRLADRFARGGMPEWSNGLDSKSSVQLAVPWVRIHSLRHYIL